MDGKCQSWHLNGQLKEEADNVENIRSAKRAYYPSGNLEMIEEYHADGTGKAVKLWYDSGQVQFDNRSDGTSFQYSKTGVLTLKALRTGDLNNGGHFISWEYGNDGVIKKETKQYYVGGLLHGYERTFYDTGELKRESDYTNGYVNKVIKAFKKNGEISVK